MDEMGRFDRTGELGVHLGDIARVWSEVLDRSDAGGIELFGRFDAIARHWAGLNREVLHPYGVNYAELTTLGILRTTRPSPRRSPTELRGLVGQTSAGMTRILDKLEAEGLLKREASPDDGRRVDIVLSRRGGRLAEAASRELFEIQSALLASVGKRELDATIRTLDTLLTAFIERKR
jgi:DNA-binding MarR family transcriptional regulator